MSNQNDIPLKIELLSSSEDSKFRLRSKREIQSILNGIAKEGSRAVLYYDDGNSFTLASMLKATEQGMWLDIGSTSSISKSVLLSKKVVFISSHRHVKVQFVTNSLKSVLYEKSDALFMPLPESLLRIQRREYFRLTTPVSNPLKCIIPIITPTYVDCEEEGADLRREVTIMDISGGGVALVCEAYDTQLEPGNTYEDCKISLPGIGTIITTVIVKNSFEVTLANGQISRRAGCEFLQLSGAADTLLQLYVTQLQTESLART